MDITERTYLDPSLPSPTDSAIDAAIDKAIGHHRPDGCVWCVALAANPAPGITTVVPF